MRFFKARPTIAVLDIAGTIDEANALRILVLLRNTDWARRNIVGLIVRICSNGGSLGAAQAICEGIDTVRAETGILTVALGTETVLSAAFYVAYACDMFIATPAATLGNVGAIVGSINSAPLAEKLGVFFDPVRTGLGKGGLHPLAKDDPTHRALLQLLVSDVGEQFFQWVKERAGVDDACIEVLRDGRMISGRQAERMGLVSGCGGFYAALTKVCEETRQENPILVWLNPVQAGLMSKVIKSIKAFF